MYIKIYHKFKFIQSDPRRVGKQAGADEYPNKRIGFVHIDDVVTAHLLAMEVPEAHGRYICSSDVAHFGDIMGMLQKKYPKLRVPSR